ncbi:MAG: patatin-like phospholipase family protein [Pyrinomonadaceae bacterium]
MTKKLIAAIFIISITTFPGGFGQSTAAKKRPTVGLVLSGGGARGFAHIGVLKVLDANHIPVDYIAGTSMGGLVGAMYAMGKSPAEIEAIVAGLDWDPLLRPRVDAEDLSYRRKQDRLNIPAALTLTGKGTDLKLPNALNSGHAIGLLLDRLTLRYAPATDFSDLPIPFHTVGTDMLKGEAVTLKSGSLSRSLRATMSIPGIFSPVEVDGKYLSDGGLVNNIPTDVVKAMGADIVVVINIESQAGGREVLETLPGILSQTINISTLDNSRRSLRQADFIIAPELGIYTLVDFSSSKQIIDLGQKGAEEKIGLLRSIALNDADWAEHLAARRSRELPDIPPVPNSIAVTGESPESTEMIKKKLGDKYVGEPLDDSKQDLLAKDLTELTGTSRFDSLDYQIGDEAGKKVLLIGSNAIGGGASKKTRLEVGVDVNSIASDAVDFNLLARLTFFDIGKHGSEWRNDIQLGSNLLLASEYYRPFGQTRFFIAPRAFYERRGIDLYVDSNRIANYSAQNAEVGVDVGYGFSTRSEVRAGYAFGYQSASLRIGDPLLPRANGTFSTAGLRWNYDSLDNAVVPTRGILSRNRANYYFDNAGAIGGFTQAETRTSIFHSINERNILFGIGSAGTTFGAEAPVLRQFTLGGLFRIGGYGYEEFRGSNYLHGGAGFLTSPKTFPTILGRKIYLGAWYEGGSMFETFDNARYRQSVSGGAIVDTPIGPIFLGGGINERGRGQFYFSFGRVFR